MSQWLWKRVLKFWDVYLDADVYEAVGRAEFEIFQESFRRWDKTTLPLDYIRGARVILLFQGGYMVGGCLIQKDQTKFRTQSLLPYDHLVQVGDVEINGLWFSPEATEGNRLALYIRVLREILELPSDAQCFFSYEKQKVGLAPFYESFTREVLYEGVVPALEGMSGEAVERICYTTPHCLCQKLPRVLKNRIVRILKKRS